MITVHQLQRTFRLLLATVCLCIGVGSVAQASDSGRAVFQRLSRADGLSGHSVTAVLQDQEGQIWLGTSSGLDRFDGQVLHSLGHLESGGSAADLQELSVTALCEDRQGALWIGTRAGGIRRLDASRSRLEHLPGISPADVASAAADGSPSHRNGCDEIEALACDARGRIWVATRGGLLRYDVEDADGVPVPQIAIDEVRVRALFLDPEQTLWIGSEEGRLYRMAGSDPRPVPVAIFETAITSLAGHFDGGLWVGTSGSGVQIFTRRPDGAGWQQRPLESTGEIAELGMAKSTVLPREITSMTTDRHGDLWAGTLRGVLHWRRADQRHELLRSDPRDATTLAGDRVRSVFLDRGRVLWLGLDQAGVSRLDLRGSWFERFLSGGPDSEALSHDSIRAFAPGLAGSLWIGTERGLNLWDPRTSVCRPFLAEDTPGLDDDLINALARDARGRLWVGTRGAGLACLEDGQFRGYRSSDGDRPAGADAVGTLFVHPVDGRLWVGTEGGGLWWRNEARDRLELVAETQDSALASVTALAAADGDNVWAGSKHGLFHVNAATGEALAPRQIWPDTDFVERLSVRCLLRDTARNCLWLGSDGMGLFALDLRSGGWQVHTRNNADLPSDSIAALTLDDEGRLWISAESGVAMIEIFDRDGVGASEDAGAVVSARRFSIRDGLQEGAFHRGAALTALDGRLYFGGDRGFNRIDPEGLPPMPSPPTPVLTRLELLGAPVVPEVGGVLELPLALTEAVRIPNQSRNRMSIRFSALDYSGADAPRFRYRLVGLEEEWQPAGGERRATYTALEPGSYRFEVQSSLDGRRWSEAEMASLEVRVSAAWHETWWARILGGVAVLVSIGGVFLAILRGREASLLHRRERLEMKCSRAEAALSRQLQGALLLQRTGRGMPADQGGDDGDPNTFDATLAELGQHFGVDRCQVLRPGGAARSLDESGDADSHNDGNDAVDGESVVIAEWTAEGVAPASTLTVPVSGAELLESARLLQGAIGSDDIASDPSLGDWRVALAEHGISSLLIVRTHYLNRANGFLLLQQCGEIRRWQNDEKQLLETVAGQFGMAIAQLELTAKEARHRHDLEEAREAAEVASRAKSDFLAKMTHELRTPLNAIIGFSEIIKNEGGLSPSVESHVDVINSSGEHLLSVINEVLEMSRIESGKSDIRMDRFSPEELVRSVGDMLSLTAEKKGLEFQLDLRSELPVEIEADKGKLRQVMINLLGNAIKFTSKGWVRLSVAVEEMSHGGDLGTRAGDAGGSLPRVRFWFQVCDTGAGISETELPSIFEKFAQSETGRGAKDSSGLGLTIARHFVDMMGGHLTVESKVDVGTAFTFHIDALDTSAEVAARGAAGVGGEGSGQAQAAAVKSVEGLEEGHEEVRILVAEDQPVNRLLLRKILGKAGFAMEEACNGSEAVEKFHSWQPHLILMDEDMPGMCGTAAARRITELAGDERPPMVSLTAFALDEQRRAALDAGCVDFLSKPFKANDLFAVIQKHLPVRYRYSRPKDEPGGEARNAA